MDERIINILTKKFHDLTLDDMKFLVSIDDFDIPPPYSVTELIEKEEKERNAQIITVNTNQNDNHENSGSAQTIGQERDALLNVYREDEFSSDDDDANNDVSNSLPHAEKSKSFHSHKLRRNPKKVSFPDFIT